MERPIEEEMSVRIEERTQNLEVGEHYQIFLQKYQTLKTPNIRSMPKIS